MRLLLSHFVGWLADRRIPRFLRSFVFRTYARFTGASLDEIRLGLAEFPSLQAFFIRHLKEGARTFPADPKALPSPVDGTVQSFETVRAGRTLQAKGRDYAVRQLVGQVAPDLDFEDWQAWTIYLSPRDYHRIHTPVAGTLREAQWMDGERFSVAPKVLLKRDVLAINERCSLLIETEQGPAVLVLVGALNVGRIRVVGVPPQNTVQQLDRPLRRGDEIARFEMGSTIVLLTPPTKGGGPSPLTELLPGTVLQLGQTIGVS